ncbi:MAG: hypothetical protein ACOZBZ_02310 [Patescibacteria group bacterium]
MNSTKKTKGLEPLGNILAQFNSLKDKYISREFQKYGYDLAVELGDVEHKALYIKLAKELPREILEQARNFVKDAGRVKSKARLFMWRVKFLKEKQRANPVSAKGGFTGWKLEQLRKGSQK